MNNGLTQKEIRQIRDIVKKANNQQLSWLIIQLEKELEDRSMLEFDMEVM